MAYLSPTYQSEPPLYKIQSFKGVNKSVTPTQIDYNASPDMKNIFLDERGALNKRFGFTRKFTLPLGTGPINGMFLYKKQGVSPIFIFAWNTRLYKQDGSSAPVQIFSGLADAPVNFFEMNNLCYIMDGTGYFVYDGTTVTSVDPYIPQLTISGKPITGGGTPLEEWNLIGSKFKETFSGDAAGKDFPLALTNLDAVPPTVTVNGVSTTAFTTNYVTGVVSFTTAPSTGTNNVVIIAQKTIVGMGDKIKRCTFSMNFGGTNDTRVFMGGNSLFPNFIFRSALYDPSYFPENGFYQVGTRESAVTGFQKQYSYLLVFKERSTFNIEYHLDENGLATFPIKPLNDTTGCYATRSIELVDNNPIFLDRNGVFVFNQTNVRDERNVEHISSFVDIDLLKEPMMEKAVSIDFERKYHLALNGNVYVYDYGIQEWYVYDNIHATCFLIIDKYLYFGSEGMIYRFMDLEDDRPYNDDGEPIVAYWKSKVMSFDSEQELKIVDKVFYTMLPSAHTSCDLFYETDKRDYRFFKTIRKELISYRRIQYNLWSYDARDFPQEAVNRIKVKKIIYIQLELRNDKLNESLGILNIGLKYLFQRYVK